MTPDDMENLRKFATCADQHGDGMTIVPQSLLARVHSEVCALREQVSHLAPFLAIWADSYQRDYQLNGLHPGHYDMLAKTGVRMAGFARATNAPNAHQQQPPVPK